VLNGEIYACDVGGVKRAFLRAIIEDGNCPFIELEDFSVLARIRKNDELETGIITVFNRTRRILYTEVVHGVDDIEDPRLLAVYPRNDSGEEERATVNKPKKKRAVAPENIPDEAALPDTESTE